MVDKQRPSVQCMIHDTCSIQYQHSYRIIYCISNTHSVYFVLIKRRCWPTPSVEFAFIQRHSESPHRDADPPGNCDEIDFSRVSEVDRWC